VNTFRRATPSERGVDAAGLLAFVDAAENRELGLHSLMIARHGDVIAEGWWDPYSPARVHLAYSLSKTLTATAVAVLAGEGRLDIDTPVLAHFPEIDRASVSARWRAVTIAHCLSMTVGHGIDAADVIWQPADFEPAASQASQLRRIFATELAADPGTLFVYNQVATFLLSHIVSRVAGEPLHDVVRARFLDKLGATELPWHTDAFGVDLGFSGAHLTTETILAVAQLALDRGTWHGERLVADAWYDRATVPFLPQSLPVPPELGDWERGYGFSYWIQGDGFRGDGAFGQYAITFPAQGMVMAITSEIEDMQRTLDAVRGLVLPAVDRPSTPDADAALAARLTSLGYPARRGSADGSRERVELARAGFSTLAPEYDRVAIEPTPGGTRLSLRREDEWFPVEVGAATWAESELESHGMRLPVVASGGWVEPDRFVAEVRLIETPHRFIVDASTAAGEAELAWHLQPLMGPDPLACAVRRAGALMPPSWG
jgi:CubicO group peptidase (beta-lactamase class C family)